MCLSYVESERQWATTRDSMKSLVMSERENMNAGHSSALRPKGGVFWEKKKDDTVFMVDFDWGAER